MRDFEPNSMVNISKVEPNSMVNISKVEPNSLVKRSKVEPRSLVNISRVETVLAINPQQCGCLSLPTDHVERQILALQRRLMKVPGTNTQHINTHHTHSVAQLSSKLYHRFCL